MSIQIIESLDYGQSLLSDGRILKADGTIISAQQYEEAQLLAQRNKLDWFSVEVDEFMSYLDNAIFATKTYDVQEEVSLYQSKDANMHNAFREHTSSAVSKFGFAILDSEGTPFYLRAQEFSGAEKYEIAEATYSKLIYNVDKNSTEQAFEAMVDILQNFFKTEEQVGSEFSPDSETNYLIKKFIKDNHVWSMVFRNGKLSNVKQGERLHQEAEAQPKPSKLADALNSNKFSNMH